MAASDVYYMDARSESPQTGLVAKMLTVFEAAGLDQLIKFSAAELDFSIVGILSDSELSGLVDSAELPTPGLTVVFGIGKTFEF